MSLPFLSTPPSCPCHFIGMSASYSMFVPFFRCESFPYISRRADCFPCPLFPFYSPCTPLVFICVPFMSLSVPLCFPFISRCFPVMLTSYCLPSFPCTSSHFPIAPQHFPHKDTVFPAFSKRGRQKTQSFFQPGTPVLRFPKTTFSGTSSNYRAVRGEAPPPAPKPYVSDVGRGGGGQGGGYPLSSLRYPTCLRNVG